MQKKKKEAVKIKPKKEKKKVREIDSSAKITDVKKEEKVAEGLSDKIKDAEFEEFIESPNFGRFFSPVLEIRGQPAQTEIDLEQTARESQRTENTKARIDYSPLNTNYTAAGEQMGYSTEMVAPVLMPTETASNVTPQDFLTPAEWMQRNQERKIYPRITEAEAIEHSRRMPLEKEERKYQSAKLKKRY